MDHLLREKFLGGLKTKHDRCSTHQLIAVQLREAQNFANQISKGDHRRLAAGNYLGASLGPRVEALGLDKLPHRPQIAHRKRAVH